MSITFTTKLDCLVSQQLEAVHGRLLAEQAVELRLKGTAVREWRTFMNHRIGTLAKQFTRQEDVGAWAKALIEAYQDAIDNDMPTLLLWAHGFGREY